MLLAEDQELRQTFKLDRLDESLASAIQVGAGLRQGIRSDTALLELGYELLRKLRVTVVHHNRQLLLPVHRLVEEVLGLLHYSSRIWVLG